MTAGRLRPRRARRPDDPRLPGCAASCRCRRCAERSEAEAARTQPRDQQSHGCGSVPAIRSRVCVMAVVNDDDVSGGGLAGEASGHAIGARTPPPVPVPQAPAPAGEPVARPFQPSVHGALRQPACGRNSRQGSWPAMRVIRRARASRVAASECGDVSISRLVPLCRPMACPSFASRLTIGSVSAVMCSSIRKKVARTPASCKASSSGGVQSRFGPSSNVR